MVTTLQNTVSAETGVQYTPVIQIEGLRHSYGSRTALNGVSFDVRPGEIFALLGPNGSGKTTLFRILSTLMLPVGGRSLIAGFDPAQQPDEVRRRIGVVFQAQSVDIKLTAAENLWHQGHLYGMRGAMLQERIAEMLQRVGLADRAKEKVETFSGGMKRRVELAKGLMHRPSVLLLDEPTTGLDPGARRDLWQYLHELRNQERVSVIVTTHLMEEAERCDRLAILNNGEVVAMGTPAELRSQIGGDVIILETSQPESLALRIEQRFRIQTSVLDGKIRMERREGHRFATELVESFPGEIESISISKPTLEDVFIHRTGHRFWTEAQPEEKK
ncbi:MAG TPA: ABC transporter ATP-binding protein [Candidatus Angelobacter sp.]|jgi:ABC-2 type transport system ATP-binding protein|nr:ABC transporter ATP-binding protein [Candidatus Angelobacter sp.]